MGTLNEHSAIQKAAKSVLSRLADSFVPEDSEHTISLRAVELLREYGIEETWYYDCPALVLLGSRSCLSVSGREYKPNSEAIGQHNVITVDLSPLRNNVWGDCARTFYFENGRCTLAPQTSEFKRGFEVLLLLHEAVKTFAKPEMTFEDLFEFGNAEIKRHGFENLDFAGNLGHSIVSRRDDRCYVERGNKKLLREVPLFTFEPHVRISGGAWGFKHEDIYCFTETGTLNAL